MVLAAVGAVSPGRVWGIQGKVEVAAVEVGMQV